MGGRFDADGLQTRVESQLRRWEVPSAVMSIVKDGKILFSGGVGMRDNKDRPADGRTLYEIASCTKAFTAAAAGVLATEGKLDFDAPVIEYMPSFRLSDDYAASHLTVRDFLSHRSGLPRHEYAWYGTGFTREELFRNLRHLQINAPLRYRFQYSNFNYFIVGCLIEAISGMKIEDFLKEKLLTPLEMDRSYTYFSEIQKHQNSALPFGHDEEYVMTGIRQIPYYASPAENDAAGTGDPTAAAGCVVSCADDMAKWLLFNLNGGKIGDRQLVKKELMDVIFSPHIFLGGGAYAPEQSAGHYALGWEVFDYRGQRMLQHGGNINGFTSFAAVLPDRQIGVFVSANMNVTMLVDAIGLSVIDDLLQAEDGGWDERMRQYNEALFKQVCEIYAAAGGDSVPGTAPSHPLADYAGEYQAPGYRRFRVEYDGQGLLADFNTFRVPLRHHHYDSFATCGVIGELPSGLVLSFQADPSGAIRTLSVKLGSEQGLSPIVFTK